MSDDDLEDKNKVTRRDFVTLTACSMTAVGAACATWPLIDSLNPSADVLALSSIDVDLSAINPGKTVVVKWRGKPVFITHRTEQEIKEARDASLNELKDPEEDSKRVKEGHEQWLVTIGICTHLGCSPKYEPEIGAVSFDNDWKGGFLCACHGSKFDLAGRVFSGVPAPTNLEVPPHMYVSDDVILVGVDEEVS